MNTTKLPGKEALNYISSFLPDPRKVECKWWSDDANLILLYFLSKGLRKDKSYQTRKADLGRFFRERRFVFTDLAINCQITRFCVYRDSMAYYGDARALELLCELEDMAPTVIDKTGKEFSRSVFKGIRECIYKYRNDPYFKIDTGTYKLIAVDAPALRRETLSQADIQEKVDTICRACPYIQFRSYEDMYESPLPEGNEIDAEV